MEITRDIGGFIFVLIAISPYLIGLLLSLALMAYIEKKL